MWCRPQLRAAGWSDSEVRSDLRSGRLVAVRRGAYVPGDHPGLSDQETRHLLAVRAERPRVAADAVASHVSAALLHGLPVWGLALNRVHVTRDRRNGGRIGPSVHVHTAGLDPADVARVDGIAVTSLCRTVLDLGRTAPFEQAVVVADAALRAGVDRTALGGALLGVARWPGAAAARRVAAFADGRSESVGESRSRVAIHAAGLPAPVPQCEVRSDGRLLARCDFGWPDRGVVGEFDGRLKYGRLLRPGQGPGDAVFAEKLREDDLRATGLTVVRWTWGDLADFRSTATRIRRALAA